MDRIISLLRGIEKATGELVHIDDDAISKNDTYSSSKIVSLLADAGFTVSIVDALPQIGDKKYIYFLPAEDQSQGNVYDEYMYIDNKFEKIGSTSIDLSDYVTTSTLNSALSGKQDILSGGNGISIIDNTVSLKGSAITQPINITTSSTYPYPFALSNGSSTYVSMADYYISMESSSTLQLSGSVYAGLKSDKMVQLMTRGYNVLSANGTGSYIDNITIGGTGSAWYYTNTQLQAGSNTKIAMSGNGISMYQDNYTPFLEATGSSNLSLGRGQTYVNLGGSSTSVLSISGSMACISGHSSTKIGRYASGSMSGVQINDGNICIGSISGSQGINIGGWPINMSQSGYSINIDGQAGIRLSGSGVYLNMWNQSCYLSGSSISLFQGSGVCLYAYSGTQYFGNSLVTTYLSGSAIQIGDITSQIDVGSGMFVTDTTKSRAFTIGSGYTECTFHTTLIQLPNQPSLSAVSGMENYYVLIKPSGVGHMHQMTLTELKKALDAIVIE